MFRRCLSALFWCNRTPVLETRRCGMPPRYLLKVPMLSRSQKEKWSRWWTGAMSRLPRSISKFSLPLNSFKHMMGSLAKWKRGLSLDCTTRNFFLQRSKHGRSRGKAVKFSWKLFHEEIHFFLSVGPPLGVWSHLKLNFISITRYDLFLTFLRRSEEILISLWRINARHAKLNFLLVIADWFIELFAPVVVGRSYWSSISFSTFIWIPR